MDKINSEPIEILLVEDNEDDVFFILQVFKKAKVKNTINVAKDGVEAMEYLRKEGKYEKSSTPDIILLDLNLPKKDGHEVLAEVKDDSILKRIPVIILTTSKSDEDILKTYNHHANCFISKPVRMEDFEKVMRSMENFWFLIVKLPKARTNNNFAK